jgi:ribosomal protein S18 acetylase RimI-like enzyme
MIAALLLDHAQKVQGVGLVGLGGQQLGVEAGGLVQAAGLVARHGLGEQSRRQADRVLPIPRGTLLLRFERGSRREDGEMFRLGKRPPVAARGDKRGDDGKRRLMPGRDAQIRPYQPRDLDALYRICLLTSDAGADGSAIYRDPKLVGHLYAGPYGVLSSETAFVVEDEEGVGGYILGAIDTRAFEARQEAEWWPGLRPLYADPTGTPPEDWNADQRAAWLIHHRFPAPRRVVTPFPSHLHIDLLPRLQGQGLGRRLIDLWLETAKAMGSRGVHLGVNRANARAIRFYLAYGLDQLDLPIPSGPPALYFTRDLNSTASVC